MTVNILLTRIRVYAGCIRQEIVKATVGVIFRIDLCQFFASFNLV